MSSPHTLTLNNVTNATGSCSMQLQTSFLTSDLLVSLISLPVQNGAGLELTHFPRWFSRGYSMQRLTLRSSQRWRARTETRRRRRRRRRRLRSRRQTSPRNQQRWVMLVLAHRVYGSWKGDSVISHFLCLIKYWDNIFRYIIEPKWKKIVQGLTFFLISNMKHFKKKH